MIAYLAGVMPSAALQLVVATLDEVTKGRGTGKLSFGILLALWAASNALNSAYDVTETRPWWRVRLMSLAMTVALSILIISALILVLYGGQFGEALANRVNAGSAFSITRNLQRLPR